MVASYCTVACRSSFVVEMLVDDLEAFETVLESVALLAPRKADPSATLPNLDELWLTPHAILIGPPGNRKLPPCLLYTSPSPRD